MKLNKRRIHWLIRQKQKGVTSKDLAVTMKLSRRRVEQIWKRWDLEGELSRPIDAPMRLSYVPGEIRDGRKGT